MNSKYDQHLEFLISNLSELGFEACAKNIGVTESALRKKVSEWRLEGIHIPYVKGVPVGTITIRNDRGIMRKFIKTESGWRRIERITPYKNGGEERSRQRPKAKVMMKRAPKPEPVRLPDRQINEAEYRYVRIDSKTLVLRKIQAA